jgi:hypothetical protein
MTETEKTCYLCDCGPDGDDKIITDQDGHDVHISCAESLAEHERLNADAPLPDEPPEQECPYCGGGIG